MDYGIEDVANNSLTFAWTLNNRTVETNVTFEPQDVNGITFNSNTDKLLESITGLISGTTYVVTMTPFLVGKLGDPRKFRVTTNLSNADFYTPYFLTNNVSGFLRLEEAKGRFRNFTVSLPTVGRLIRRTFENKSDEVTFSQLDSGLRHEVIVRIYSDIEMKESSILVPTKPADMEIVSQDFLLHESVRLTAYFPGFGTSVNYSAADLDGATVFEKTILFQNFITFEETFNMGWNLTSQVLGVLNGNSVTFTVGGPIITKIDILQNGNSTAPLRVSLEYKFRLDQIEIEIRPDQNAPLWKRVFNQSEIPFVIEGTHPGTMLHVIFIPSYRGIRGPANTVYFPTKPRVKWDYVASSVEYTREVNYTDVRFRAYFEGDVSLWTVGLDSEEKLNKLGLYKHPQNH